MQGQEFGVVQQYKSDVAFKTLVEGINDNLYFIPKYQRKFRWKEEQVKELARSLVRGYPIPPIYAYRNDRGQLEILDGQQRIMSLFFYYMGKFINTNKLSAVNYRKLNVSDMKYQEVLERNFELVDMITYLDDSKKINISYSALQTEFRRKVDYTTITVIELRWDRKEERMFDIQKIFENLNSKGTMLSAQEVRNGVYNCAFYDMLREFNEQNTDWEKIRGRESDKEEDMEMLLRLCTVEKNVKWNGTEFLVENYQSNYSVWMDEFSEQAVTMDFQEIENYKEVLGNFCKCFQSARVIGLQKALIESLFVVIRKTGIVIRITEELIELVLEDEKYKKNSRQGMVKKSKMNGRWVAVYEVLSKYVE